MLTPPALAPLMWLPGLAMEAAVRLRNRLYDARITPVRRLPRPVVSVGNLTLGGAGKTPLVLYLGARLAARGRVPAILSRGYGRSHPERTHVVPPGAAFPAAETLLGDEPALVRRRLPDAWLGVAADRRAVGLEIAAREPRAVFVLDDGYQHRRLHRDLDLVVLDRTQPLAANRVVPRGTLREPPAALARAGVVVLHGARPAGPDPLAEAVRRLTPRALLLHAESRIARFVPLEAWRDGGVAGDAPPARAYVVGAVGNPGRYQRDVEARGIRVTGTRFFRDHHRISEPEIRACAASAARSGAEALVVTEKDAIKLAAVSLAPVLVAVQELALADAAELDRRLDRLEADR